MENIFHINGYDWQRETQISIQNIIANQKKYLEIR